MQEEQLRKLLQYLSIHSPFYRNWFETHSVQIDHIQTISDLMQIPTVGKEDIQQHNMDFLCVPRSSIIEYTATSGTLGSPVTMALTESDIKRLAYNEALSFSLMELKPGDTVQLMLTLDRQFMAGMAYYLGLRELLVASVRTGPGLPSMQLDTLQRLQCSTLVAVPSFLIKLIDYARSVNMDLHQLPVRSVLCIGENIRNVDGELNALGALISSQWRLNLHGTYASTEMQTAFTECHHGLGGHHHPELVIVEILDEEGRQLKAGEYGEVTITTLGVEGMPLLRYRTGDICCFDDRPCPCGRTTWRLSAVQGRKKQMIKYRGTTLYPPAVFDVLNQLEFIREYVVEVRSDVVGNDAMILHLHTPLPVDACEEKLKPFLQSRLRVVPELRYHSATEINEMLFPAGSRKAVKFIDRRKA